MEIGFEQLGSNLKKEFDEVTKDMDVTSKEIFMNQTRLMFLNAQEAEETKQLQASLIAIKKAENSATGDRDSWKAQGHNSMGGVSSSEYLNILGEQGFWSGVQAGLSETLGNLIGFTAGIQNDNLAVAKANAWPTEENASEVRTKLGGNYIKSSTLPFLLAKKECHHAIGIIDDLIKDPRVLNTKHYDELVNAKRYYNALISYASPGGHTVDDDIQGWAQEAYEILDDLQEASTGDIDRVAAKAKYEEFTRKLAEVIDTLEIPGVTYNGTYYQDETRRYQIQAKISQKNLNKIGQNKNILKVLIKGQQNQAVDTLGAGNPNYVPSDNSKKQMPPLQ
jgi:hypothetical protein